MSKEKYDDRGNVIYKVFPAWHNLEEWYKYDENNNLVYGKDSDGHEMWKDYDDNNRLIHQKGANKGSENWWRYDEKGNEIKITEEEFENINFNKRKPISRFEIMDI